MALALYSGGFFDSKVSKRNWPMHELVLEGLRRNPKIAHIPSDSHSPHAEDYFKQFQKVFRHFGVKRYLYFPVDRPFTKAQTRELLACDLIYLSGGNTYYFLRHLRHGKLLPALAKYAARGGTLMGVSAGSILMTPTIALAGLVPGESDENTVGIKNLKAMGLVDFEWYPHYTASRNSARLLPRYAKKTGRFVYAVPDGSGVLVEGRKVTIFGPITIFGGGVTGIGGE